MDTLEWKCYDLHDLKDELASFDKQKSVYIRFVCDENCDCVITLDTPPNSNKVESPFFSTCTVQMENTDLLPSGITRQKVQFTHNFVDHVLLEDLIAFIESCFTIFSSKLLYCAMHNMIALLRDNNAYNIKADLTIKRATIECQFPHRANANYEIVAHTNSFSKVIITEKTLSSRCGIWVYPNDMKKVQEDLFGPLPNNKACKKFWKKLELLENVDFRLKEDRGLYSKSFWIIPYMDQFEDDHSNQAWIEVGVTDTATRFTITVCRRSFYGGVMQHPIRNASWDDFNHVEEIGDGLHHNDVVDTCNMDNSFRV